MIAGLHPASFEDLEGFESDDALAAFQAFAASAAAIARDASPLRAALPASPGLRLAASAALGREARTADDARAFFRLHFRPYRIGGAPGFLTGYYEPWVRGSLTPTDGYTAPILARPADLVSFAPGTGPRGFDPAFAGARRLTDGSLTPYSERATIEDCAQNPILWLRDAVEVFLIHVQGSARVLLEDGRQVRLVYDGRNGLPYTSIGRILIEAGDIPENEMSLARLKDWLRAAGLRPGERGRELMRRNRSYIFYRIEEGFAPDLGPIGGAGLTLTSLRSIAVDRNLWSYGLPFWISARLPWRGEVAEPFQRLMIAQDTGAAIVGSARADLFFGGGDEAGARAGAIRHPADFTVLLPIGDPP